MHNKCSWWDRMAHRPLKCKCHNVTTHEPKALQLFTATIHKFTNKLKCSELLVPTNGLPTAALLWGAFKEMLCQTTSTPFFIMLRFTELGTRFRWLMLKCWLNQIKSFCSSHSKCKYIAESHGGWKITAIIIAKGNPLTFSADGFQW